MVKRLSTETDGNCAERAMDCFDSLLTGRSSVRTPVVPKLTGLPAPRSSGTRSARLDLTDPRAVRGSRASKSTASPASNAASSFVSPPLRDRQRVVFVDPNAPPSEAPLVDRELSLLGSKDAQEPESPVAKPSTPPAERVVVSNGAPVPRRVDLIGKPAASQPASADSSHNTSTSSQPSAPGAGPILQRPNSFSRQATNTRSLLTTSTTKFAREVTRTPVVKPEKEKENHTR